MKKDQKKLMFKRKRVRRAARLVKDEGVLSFSIKALQKVEKKRAKKSKRRKVSITMLAKYDDILHADWALEPYKPSNKKIAPPYTINWVMSPPGEGAGGGHQNIFRFINHLEEKGHKCHIYLYSGRHFQHPEDALETLKRAYPNTKATIQVLNGDMQPADAIFATGWETAYPVFNDPSKARRFYFVQDFEPYFYPASSEYVLAENTYRFNFHGITAGSWLAHKLSRDYGMTCDHYNFGADKSLYKFENKTERKEIFFYARPVTARRGFELGIMALQLFKEKMPDYTITLAGWDVSEYKIPFAYKNLKTLKLNELSDVYNNCAAALVISLTNMSLMPLELLATGAIPIVTDGPNNVEVSNNPFIKFAHASPDALADALVQTVTKKNLPKYAEEASRSVKNLDWHDSCDTLEAILERELNG